MIQAEYRIAEAGGERGRRVVVTGMGCLSPLGNNLQTNWENLKAGRSGIGPLTQFDAHRLPTRIAGEVLDFDPESVLDSKTVRRMDRFQQFAYAAAVEALNASGLAIQEHNGERVGVVIGSGIGGLTSLVEQIHVLDTRGPDRVSPFLITKMAADLAPGMISILLGARGPNFATISACATGAHAIGESAEIIRRGQADAMLAGGAEAAIVEVGFASFCKMRALSTRNDDPEGASRPFDAARDGFVMSEGAGVVVLESLEHAHGRGAPILAEVIGYGSTADAHHLTEPAPGGSGAARAMRAALAQAGIGPGEVDYINAHATSTEIGDVREVDALRSVFGERYRSIPVGATKSMTGHLFGAAGAFESIVCIQAIRDRFLPPTINQETPDPGCDVDSIPNTGRQVDVDIAMNNAYGFGGHNVSLLFRRCQ